jgi:hypothetical protein
MAFEVQHYTLCDGWINCWSRVEDGKEMPSIYNTYMDALNALSDFISQEHEAYREGAIDSMYDASEFRIMEII